MKYDREPIDYHALNENNIDRIQLDMVPAGVRLLEIGCATGVMSAYLAEEKGCRVTGVEPDERMAAVARGNCAAVITGPIDGTDAQNTLDRAVAADGPFQAVFMSQVIEHIAEPGAVLVRLRDWLAADGDLIVSTCNIAHWRCRLDLLRGRWEYTDYGIMDRTHLRFFTIPGFRRLLADTGYRIVGEGWSFEDFCPFRLLIDKRVMAPSDVLRLVPVVGMRLRRWYIRRFGALIATQFAFKARPDAEAGGGP